MMRTLVSIFIAAVLALTVSYAEAQRRRGPGGPAVKDISILGAVSYSEKKIKGLMRTKESKFLRTKRLRESALESDLVSIAAFYRRNGFLDAAVTDQLRYDDDKQNVWITILIQEGAQTLIKDLILTGNKQVPHAVLSKDLALKVGKPMDQRKISEDKYKLYSLYADRGFVYASVEHEVAIADGEATITYDIREGEPAGIDKIEVRGNSRVSETIIRREVELKPGDRFSRKKLLDSQQSLYDTGLFKDVEIEPSAGAAEATSVDLLVKVKERKMREVSFALGYGTRDETRVTVGWHHRNLWDSGRELELRTILASKDYDRGLTRKRGDVSLTDRWLLGRRVTGGIAIFGQESLEEYGEVEQGEYTLIRVGADLSLKKDFSRETNLTFTYTHEIVDVGDQNWELQDDEDLRLTLGQEVNRSATVLLERDTRLPFFDPRGGSLTRLIARTSGGIFGGDNSYSKITWSWARYYSFYGRSVIAIGSRVGYAEAFGASEDKGVPEYERFTAGGSSTIRGYDEREFGPGDFLLLMNVEFRFSLIWRFVGVAFLDMGNSWPSVGDVTRTDFDPKVSADEYAARRDSDVKYSIGVGLGIRTPVGPARVDYGFRLKRGFLEPGEKESAGMVHITVGHAF
jgi:outer membrane protein insertion porin family